MAEHEFYAQPTVFDLWQSRSRRWISQHFGHYSPFMWSLGFSVLSLGCFLVAFGTSLSLLLDHWQVSWNDALARWLVLCMATAACGWLLRQALQAWPRQARLPETLDLIADLASWRRPVPATRRTRVQERPIGVSIERRARKRENTAEARQVQAFYTGVREAGVNVTIAQSLFAAGIRSPRQVRKTGNRALLAIHGVGPATVRKLRARFG